MGPKPMGRPTLGSSARSSGAPGATPWSARVCAAQCALATGRASLRAPAAPLDCNRVGYFNRPIVYDV